MLHRLCALFLWHLGRQRVCSDFAYVLMGWEMATLIEHIEFDLRCICTHQYIQREYIHRTGNQLFLLPWLFINHIDSLAPQLYNHLAPSVLNVPSLSYYLNKQAACPPEILSFLLLIRGTEVCVPCCTDFWGHFRF